LRRSDPNCREFGSRRGRSPPALFVVGAGGQLTPQRGRTATAPTAIEARRKGPESLAGQREGAALAPRLKAQHAALGTKGRQIETEAAPIRYVAELVGADTDSERAIRWLILMMVPCCDPLAIALKAAASARRPTTA